MYTSEAGMRTNIDISDELLEEAMRISGLSTKKAVVEKALSDLVGEARRRQAIKNIWGLGWEGDLDDIRIDRPSASEE
jgi:Arc/MetJ family transcription regulator